VETTRAERRRRTEERILAAARTLFAEHGFQRTTIRAVAAAADVDPALVMHYFGTKQVLFSQAVRGVDDPAGGGEPAEVVDRLLQSLGVKLGGLPPATLVMLRSMLTHPDAATAVRDALGRQIDQIAAASPGTDAALRSALATTMMLGICIGHQLLDLPPLAEASFDDIARLLRPSLLALMEQPPEPKLQAKP
jgi:AcrR family transcriptional regulator